MPKTSVSTSFGIGIDSLTTVPSPEAGARTLVVMGSNTGDDDGEGREQLERVSVAIPVSGGSRVVEHLADELTRYVPVWEHLRAGLGHAFGQDVPGSFAIDLSSRTVLAWYPTYCHAHDDGRPWFGYVAGTQQQWSRLPGSPTPAAFAEVLALMRQCRIDPPTTPAGHEH